MKRLYFPPAARLLLLVLLCLLGSWLVGCATNEDNIAERPWNAPKGWEGGVPSDLYDRERQ